MRYDDSDSYAIIWFADYPFLLRCIFCNFTSSSLYVIIVKALKTQSVEPVIVMILSGHVPSEMLTRALLCGVRRLKDN